MENKLWIRFICKDLNIKPLSLNISCQLLPIHLQVSPHNLEKEVIIWLLLFLLLIIQVQISLVQFWKLMLNCHCINMISNIFKCKIISSWQVVVLKSHEASHFWHIYISFQLSCVCFELLDQQVDEFCW